MKILLHIYKSKLTPNEIKEDRACKTAPVCILFYSNIFMGSCEDGLNNLWQHEYWKLWHILMTILKAN